MGGEEPIIEPVGGGGVKAIEKRRCNTVWLGAQRFKGGRAPVKARIPGADLLTNIAAEDAVAKVRPQSYRNRRLRLDCPVGNAALRVEVKGADEGARRAAAEAARAAAAGPRCRSTRGQGNGPRAVVASGGEAAQHRICLWLGRQRAIHCFGVCQFLGHKQRGEQEPATRLGMDDAAVLAEEAQAGHLRPVALEQRAAVHQRLGQRGAAALGAQECVERVQAGTEYVVVVIAPGVGGNEAARRVVAHSRRQRRDGVAGGQHDQRAHGGAAGAHKQRRVAPQRAAALEVVHGAGAPCIEPAIE